MVSFCWEQWSLTGCLSCIPSPPQGRWVMEVVGGCQFLFHTRRHSLELSPKQTWVQHFLFIELLLWPKTPGCSMLHTTKQWHWTGLLITSKNWVLDWYSAGWSKKRCLLYKHDILSILFKHNNDCQSNWVISNLFQRIQMMQRCSNYMTGNKCCSS